MRSLTDKLNTQKKLSFDEWKEIIQNGDRPYTAGIARKITDKSFGNRIYIRGLIEVSNVCRNNCLYCGIRRENNVSPFRLNKNDVMQCCENGYKLGFRTFVLQGGEAGWYSTSKIAEIVSEIKSRYPDCAVTLSLGEMERDDYQKLFDAGADRYLLRQEAASCELYEKIHPTEMSHSHRIKALHNLKEIGFQTGCGLMVGVPHQTVSHLAEDMMFMQEFNPHMIGIGPFMPAGGTPFEKSPPGDGELTLHILSLCRIMFPKSMLPATTALGSLLPDGRIKAIIAGANVVMPNLTPEENRGNYLLYDNKIGTKGAPEDGLTALKTDLEKIGFEIEVTRGDYCNNE